MSRTLDFWKNQLYGTNLWRSIEDEYESLPTKPLVIERERWHLRQMHSQRRVNYLAKWLASNVGRYFTGVTVRVQSVWTDLTPQAHFDYLDSAAILHSANCELADLLVVLTVSDTASRTDTTRAALLQAKVVQTWDRLDAASSGSSSDVERNLLELSNGRVEVRRGTKATSRRFPNSPYDLSNGLPGLPDYARYLLIPKELKSIRDQPYRALWPQSRAHVHGTVDSMAELLLGMTGLRPQWRQVAGKTVLPAMSLPLDDWSKLVHDLLTMYSGSRKRVKKFEEHTKTTFPRVVDSGTYTARSLWASALFWTKKVALWFAYETAMAVETLMFKTPIAPHSNGHGGSGDEDGDFDGGGFMLLEISVSVADCRQFEDEGRD
jgi:hypothetical protein